MYIIEILMIGDKKCYMVRTPNGAPLYGSFDIKDIAWYLENEPNKNTPAKE